MVVGEELCIPHGGIWVATPEAGLYLTDLLSDAVTADVLPLDHGDIVYGSSKFTIATCKSPPLRLVRSGVDISL
ncbi:MAG: hypothetical protein IPN17_29980 [Deltaproteobacteria bacterium]|nr:hypothetical protein [Deltaproteobacteria bacterium]